MRTRIFCFFSTGFIFSILTSACLGSFASPTVTPTLTSTPIPPPTKTPTIIPSPTVTPSPTPEGATSFDSASNQYIRKENGKTYYWIPIQINAYDNQEGHWFELRNLNDIPLIGHEENYFDLPNSMLMEAYVLDNQVLQQQSGGMYIRHPGGTTVYRTMQDKTASFNGMLLTELFHRLYGEDANVKENWTSYRSKLEDGDLSLLFTTSSGKYEYKPFQGGTYMALVVPWELSDPIKDPQFMDFYAGSHGRSITLGDADGNLIAIIASEEPIDTLVDYKIRGLLLCPWIQVILSEDVSHEFYKNKYGPCSQRMMELVDWAGRGPVYDPTHNRYIEIIREH
jgi:hypothetical protein